MNSKAAFNRTNFLLFIGVISVIGAIYLLLSVFAGSGSQSVDVVQGQLQTNDGQAFGGSFVQFNGSSQNDNVPVPEDGKAYLGASFNGERYVNGNKITLGNAGSRDEIESKIGSKLGSNFKFAVDKAYRDFEDDVPTNYEKNTIAEGRIPYFAWKPKRNGSAIYWKDVASGAEDSYLIESAKKIKALNTPVFITFHHEPNDNVGEVDPGANADDKKTKFGTALEYAAAHRHVVDIFRQEGATNVSWVWGTLTAYSFTSDVDLVNAMYPGDDYVDWIGATGYNWSPCRRASDSWKFPSKIFQSFFNWSSQHPDIPIFVSEWATQEDYIGDIQCDQHNRANENYVNGNNIEDVQIVDKNKKADWFNQAMLDFKNNPQVKAVSYYHSDIIYPWWIDTSDESLTGFSQMANNSYFKPAL